MSEPRSLRWRCRRGMLELDVLLERFLEVGYRELDARGRETFDQLLESEDDLLWDWMSGKVDPGEQRIADIIKLIRADD
jgi:antitoxin CptB